MENVQLLSYLQFMTFALGLALWLCIVLTVALIFSERERRKLKPKYKITVDDRSFRLSLTKATDAFNLFKRDLYKRLAVGLDMPAWMLQAAQVLYFADGPAEGETVNNTALVSKLRQKVILSSSYPREIQEKAPFESGPVYQLERIELATMARRPRGIMRYQGEGEWMPGPGGKPLGLAMFGSEICRLRFVGGPCDDQERANVEQLTSVGSVLLIGGVFVWPQTMGKTEVGCTTATREGSVYRLEYVEDQDGGKVGFMEYRGEGSITRGGTWKTT